MGAATIVFFISLFLPWFTSSAGIYGASVNGLWHGYMYIGLFKPSGAGVVSIGWGFGAFVGLVAAVAAVAPLGLPFLRSRAGR